LAQVASSVSGLGYDPSPTQGAGHYDPGDLRHSDAAITRRSYIKTSEVDSESMAAMQALETSMDNQRTTEMIADEGMHRTMM
jgi:hypothetical protein